MLFVITGPSGCGKSTLVRRILADMDNMDFSVSFTTRARRDSEEEARDYYFVSKEEFEQLIRENKLVEWAIVHGNYYGTSKREVEKKGAQKDLLLDIDVQGAQQIKGKFRKAVFIFIFPPEFQELKRRLEKRGGESLESIQGRLEEAKKEIRAYPDFEFVVVNDKLEKAVQELKAIILSTRCRLTERQKEIVPILRSFIRGNEKK